MQAAIFFPAERILSQKVILEQEDRLPIRRGTPGRFSNSGITGAVMERFLATPAGQTGAGCECEVDFRIY
jgi:hypothetical protein